MYLPITNLFQLVSYWTANCLFRMPFSFRVMPFNLTLSVTNRCVAKCRTCSIWKIYTDNPDLAESELTADEWRNVIKSIGRSPAWITISGGNQFLRSDLPRIIDYVVAYCKPVIINIPVSGTMPEATCNITEDILKICSANGVKLIVNISLDGLHEKQDYIRGTEGDFIKTLEAYRRLKLLKKRYSRFSLGVYTVVSKFNAGDIKEICDFVKTQLKPDAYAIELAEYRKELKNLEDDILPPIESYRKAVKYYLKMFKGDGKGLLRLKQLIRNYYYETIDKGVKIPCHAGTVSAHISPYGDVWPCCTKTEIIGNLKEAGYDFRKIWFSRKAESVRKDIIKKRCSCTHCNPFYTNILFHAKSLMVLCGKFFKGTAPSGRKIFNRGKQVT